MSALPLLAAVGVAEMAAVVVWMVWRARRARRRPDAAVVNEVAAALAQAAESTAADTSAGRALPAVAPWLVDETVKGAYAHLRRTPPGVTR